MQRFNEKAVAGCLILSEQHERPVGAICNAMSTKVNLSQDFVVAHGQPAQVRKQVNE